MGKLAKFIFFYTDNDEGVKPVPIEWNTVTGISPLALVNALAHDIRSLTQYGKCTQPSGVWNTTITQYGKCVQDGTPTPSAPVDIVCNNGVLKLSPNLLDPSIVTSGTSSGITISEAADGTITATGSLESGTYAQFTYTMTRTLPAGTYTVSLNNPTALAAGSLVGFGINGNVSVGSRACGLNATNATKTITIDEGDVANRLVIRLNGDLTGFSMKIQVERGETDTTYHPFGAVYAYGTPEVLTVSASGAESQTVTNIPMLLAVDDYKDELEFVGGLLTHKIGVKIFDGTENFTAMSTAGAYRFSGASNIDNLQNTMVLCTHYKPESPSKNVSNMDDLAVKTNATADSNVYFKDTSCATAADLQDKFAAQYAAGTPVILLFVLAEETTEQTTAYPQLVNAKYDTASVTAAVSDIQVTFVTGAQTTPNPYSQLPILCNNGALKVVKPSGLPLGYDLVEWITVADASIDFGYKTTQDIEIESKFYRVVNNAQTLVQSDANSGGTTNTSSYITNGGYWRFGDEAISVKVIVSNDPYISLQNKEGVWINGESAGTYGEVGDFTSNNNFRTGTGPNLRYCHLTVRSYTTHEVQHDYLPCKRRSDNAYGFYDLVDEEFVTNDQATITAGNLVSDPVSVAADGTPETLMVGGGNLLDPSTSNIAIGEIVYESGSISASSPNWRTDFIPIEGGKTYIFYGRRKSDDVISAYNRINWYTAEKQNITPRPSYTKDTATVGTAPSNAAYARLSCASYNSSAAITRETFDEFNWMFAESSAELPFVPYGESQTVTDISNLLAVGDYADTEELIHGIRTGKLGVMVLDGTENFYVSTGDTYGVAIDKNKYPGSYVDAVPVLCTHLPFSTSSSTSQKDVICNRSGNYGIRMLFDETIMALAETKVAAAKVFIAAEYAKGTPVIVVYPLATETTEQGTVHALNSYEGTTVVSAATNVDPVTLEVEYASKA